jgi:hypothetical protein
MPTPYEQGQSLAWIELDTEGVRVHHATVETIEPASAPGRWTVTTDRGVSIVDGAGVGAETVPLEQDIADDLYLYGDGFLVTSTLLGMEQGSDQDYAFDLGDDLGLD